MENKKELILTRVFDVPIDLVFKAWTDQELVKEWWGPRGVTNTVCELDAVPGGKLHIVMVAGPELGELAGQEWPMTGTVKEIMAPERVVFTGNAIVEGKEVMEHITTVTLKEQDGKTHLTAHIVVTKTTPEAEGPLQGMEMGWNQQLDKLGEYLAKI